MWNLHRESPWSLAARDLTAVFQERQDILIALARLDADQLVIAEDIEPIAQSATVVVGDLLAYLPLAGLVDMDEERERLGKVLDNLNGRIRSSEGRLAGPFAEKAPADIVQKERDNLAAMQLEADAGPGAVNKTGLKDTFPEGIDQKTRMTPKSMEIILTFWEGLYNDMARQSSVFIRGSCLHFQRLEHYPALCT